MVESEHDYARQKYHKFVVHVLNFFSSNLKKYEIRYNVRCKRYKAEEHVMGVFRGEVRVERVVEWKKCSNNSSNVCLGGYQVSAKVVDTTTLLYGDTGRVGS